MSLLNNFNCQTNQSDLPVLLTVIIFYESDLLVLFMLENILLQRKYGWKILPWKVPVNLIDQNYWIQTWTYPYYLVHK